MPDSPIPASIGVAVSSNRLRAVRLDEQKAITKNVETELSNDASVAEQIVSLITRVEAPPGSAICVSVPGMVETGTARIVDSRVPALSGFDLKAELAGIVTSGLVVENDANAAAFAEFTIGAGKGSQNLFYVSLGEGVGSGLILNGEIWHGANGYAGEFGAIVVDEEGTRLEDVASIANIARRTRSRFHQDSTTTLRKLREDDISFEDILAAAELGDDLALLMLERTGTYVGTALAAVINLLNIEKVIIGGEVISTPSAVLDAAIRRARECSSPRAFAATTVELSQLDEFASATGAALIAATTGI
jgi:glucokinase